MDWAQNISYNNHCFLNRLLFAFNIESIMGFCCGSGPLLEWKDIFSANVNRIKKLLYGNQCILNDQTN
jgi:hypothetical protein